MKRLAKKTPLYLMRESRIQGCFVRKRDSVWEKTHYGTIVIMYATDDICPIDVRLCRSNFAFRMGQMFLKI